uniref:Uncharacterized protein n=1 Tax=Rhizophora mucronata TaxID=61149 RepID=A0A2P2N0H7_RHIMU
MLYVQECSLFIFSVNFWEPFFTKIFVSMTRHVETLVI